MSPAVLAGLPLGVGEVVTSGSLIIAIPLAVLAGLVSFASPCVLPLVPGYLSYVTGLTGAELAEMRSPASAVPAGAASGRPAPTTSAALGVPAGTSSALPMRHRVVLGTLGFIAGLQRRLRVLRRAVRWPGRAAAHAPGRHHPGPGRGGHRPRARVPGPGPEPAARGPLAPPTRARDLGRTSARRALRARLDPLHRAHPGRRPEPGVHRGIGAAWGVAVGGLLHRARACPSW